jgi:alanyl-tRNA synthetase
VLDTKKENDLIVHFVDRLPSKPVALFTSKVNGEKRKLSMNNHTATHLLHAALKQVLGDHVQQKGSLVNEEILRFDFSHFAKLTEEEISQVESIVNTKIRENIALNEQRNVPIAEAKNQGATALFGEKYGDFVRVITFDRNFSVELCGGTHVSSTGVIGLFKIISEGSISAGVRRIEAITAEAAEAYVNDQFQLVKEIQELLKNPRDVKKSIEALIQERNDLRKELEALHTQQAGALKGDLIRAIEQVGGTNQIIAQISMPSADALKKLAFELKNEVDNVIAILAAEIDGKPQVAVLISDNLITEKSLNAGLLVRELAKEIDGGGGGQPFFATAGGKNLAGLPSVLVKAKLLLGKI